jgi:ABC-type Na+ efflux pump permease subunit
MNARFALVSAAKDLRRRATDPLALVMWIGLPLLIGGLLSLVSGGSGSGPRGIVLLADEDASLLGTVIETGLGQGALGSLFDVTRVTRDAGRAQLDAGGASVLIVVPAGATDAVINRQALTLSVVTNPAQRILPGIVQEALELLAEATFYVQRLFGDLLPQLKAPPADAKGFPTDASVGALAVTINQRLASVQHLVLPPVLEVVNEKPAGQGAPGGFADFGRMFLPGLLFMSMLFIAQGMSGDLWEEQTQGTLRRVLSVPPAVGSFLVGKILAGSVLVGAVAAAGLLAGVVLFAVPVWRSLVALPWCVFGGTVLLALFLVPQVAASSQRGANMLTTVLVFPLIMIGGSFFPFEAMPEWMAAAGRWTPNGQAVARLKDLLNGTASLGPFVVAAVAMAVPAVASIWFAARWLPRRFGGA